MIHILDTNALVYLENEKLRVSRKLNGYVPDEIRDEFLTNSASETWFAKSEFPHPRISETEYLTEYARILNDYGGVHFYQLKGFGDVAILACLGILIQQLAPDASLFADLLPRDAVAVVSGDNELREYATDWMGDRVLLLTPEEFAEKVRTG